MGICHQVNLEYLARVVFTTGPDADGTVTAYPDTLVGTDSHTTMVNGLGVLGWGVGGIEAEAAMLGQPVSMLVPQVVGFRLTGKLREGTTATDLVLTVTEALRKHGVVGKFVEFFGPGIAELPLADRATIANMAPEYGATCGIFPVDAETLKYLRLTGRTEAHIALVEAYFREQGLFHTAAAPEAEYSSTLSLDLATVEPSVAGPKRPQDRVLLSQAAASFAQQLPSLLGPNGNQDPPPARSSAGRRKAATPPPTATPASSLGAPDPHAAAPTTVKARFGVDPDPYLDHGSIVIAAITSCTNTSNPYVMVAAGLLAKKAVEKGLRTPPWVKTSLAPGSRVVTDYYNKSGLTPYLDALRFNTVGYGCTTCIGNSGPLPTDVSQSHRRPLARRRLRPLRQPQLRGPHLPRSPRQLPHVAPAGRRLRPRRPHRPQLRHRPARQGSIRRARLPQGHLAHPGRSLRHRSRLHRLRRCSANNTQRYPRATRTGSTSSSPPATPTAGSPTPPTSAKPHTSTA